MKSSLEDFKNQLDVANNPVIRMWGDGTTGMGHQSSTVGLLKQLANPVGEEGFEYEGTIEVYYQSQNDLEKLKYLLPELKGGSSGKVEKANVKLILWNNASIPKDTVKIGLTGGADDEHNYTEKLNVKYFLRLQPYKWNLPEQIQFLEQNKKPINLNHQRALGGKTFNQRPYYIKTPISEPDWGSFTTYKTQSKIIKWLCKDLSDIEFVPVYGIRNSNMSLTGPPYERMFEVITGFLASNKDKDSIIVVGCDELKKSLELEGLMEGRPIPSEDYENKDEEDHFGQQKGSRRKVNVGPPKSLTNRRDYLTSINAVNRVRYIWHPTEVGTVRQEKGWLMEKKGRVLFLQLGRVPTPLFQILLQKTNLPPIFEGQNTANLALNIGGYYLHVAQAGSGKIQYPATIIGHELDESYSTTPFNFSSSTPRALQEVANMVNSPLSNWPKEQSKNPAERIGNFIIEYKKQKKESKGDYWEYFNDVSYFYQNPNNDKFRYGVSFLNSIIQKDHTLRKSLHLFAEDASPETSSPSSPSILETFLSKLHSNHVNGATDFIPGVLSEGSIYDFYASLLANGPSFQIKESTITPTYEPGNRLKEIELTGHSNAFGIELAVHIRFTAPNDVVVANAKLSYHEAWAPPELPWIRFSDPFLRFYTINAQTISSGAIGGTVDSLDLELALQLPVQDHKWQLIGNFDAPYPSINKFYQLAGGVDLTRALPPPFSTMAGFGVRNTQLAYDASKNHIEYVGFVFSTTNAHTLIPGLELKNILIQVTVQSPASVTERSTDWAVSGTFQLGQGKNAAIFSLGVLGPSLTLNGSLQSGEIQLSDLFSMFLPGMEFCPTKLPTITEFECSFNLGNPGNYSMSCSLNIDWKVDAPGKVLLIKDLRVYAQRAQGFLIAGLNGNISVLNEVNIFLIAQYNQVSKSWTFSGQQTSGHIQLGDLIKEYLGWDIGQSLAIDGLGLQIETQTSAFEFTGKTAEDWTVPFIDNLRVRASLTAGRGGHGSYARLKTNWTWENIHLNLWLNYHSKPGKSNYGFELSDLGVEGTIQEQQNKEWEGSLNFTRSSTLGSMVETMVGWATGSNFGLAAPWDRLNNIPLNSLSLAFNFTTKKVSFQVNIGPINIGIAGINVASVTGIGLTYSKASGVMVELHGTFRWQDDSSQPLSWDATQPENTPGPPAMGNKYIDIRLLALGQHVKVDGLAEAGNIQEAIGAMEKLPTPTSGSLPPVALDSSAGWLVGLDMGLLRIGGKEPNAGDYVFNLQVVFSDPDLYGLRISLQGKAAKIFKGLDFEVMYRKISESVGVYQAEITLPDAMRYMRVGQFNITLPVFGIAIYTNGDFKVDLGFPWNADFSRSFTFQTIIWAIVPIPVTGSIGIYFGKLSSATSTQVPTTDRGFFNPVVIFGLGIQFGLGYDFRAGMLSAGFRLTAVAIIEGVLAKWNPYTPTEGGENSDRLEDNYYFALEGTIGLIGKLYGSVDFGIVKASVNLEIKVLTQLRFAPYEPIELSISATLHASASISIDLGLFSITLHFSFSMHFQQHVTLPAIASNPPWGNGHHQPHLNREEDVVLPLHRQYSRNRMTLLDNIVDLMNAGPLIMQWENLRPAETPANLTAYLTLALTMARDENTPSPTLETQRACYVAMLMLESAPAPQDDTETCRHNAEHPEADTSFEQLCKEVFRWMLAAMGLEQRTNQEVDQSVITHAQLAQLLDYLSDPTRPIPIPLEAIEQFMGRQFRMLVRAPHEKQGGKSPIATCFPMVPSIGLSIPAYGIDPELAYTFGDYNSASPDYLDYLRQYFDKLGVNAQGRESAKYDRAGMAEGEGTSIASFVFTDYFTLLARQMVQLAINSLKDYTYLLGGQETPNGIVQWVNQQMGSGVDPYTIERLFHDNAKHELRPGATMHILEAKYTVQTKDTFASLSQNPDIGTPELTQLLEQNADTQHLLEAGVLIQFLTGVQPYTTQPGDTLAEIAAKGKLEHHIGQLATKSNIKELNGLLKPAAALLLPEFTHQVKAKETLTVLASAYGISISQLARVKENRAIENLFNALSSRELHLVQLPQFSVGQLLKEIQRTQGLQHLAGMTSRYYLAGLRLPTQGITPNKQGMWITGKPAGYKLPAMAGLYALSGQQFPIPPLVEGQPFEITFRGNASSWLSFEPANNSIASAADPSSLVIKILSDSVAAKQITSLQDFTTHNYLDTGVSEIGSQDLFSEQPNTYTFHSPMQWRSPVFTPMPSHNGYLGQQHLRLWKFPEQLAKLPDPHRHMVKPRMDIQLGRFDQATQQLQSQPAANYGYASLVEITIKKIASLPGDLTTKTTYEVMGADGEQVTILEDILSQVRSDEKIAGLHIAFLQAGHANGKEVLQTGIADQLTIALSQVNLSTDTRPPQAGMNAPFVEQGQTLINRNLEFIRLLWQAGITRAGGYYLYYVNRESKTGLPDHIFNSDGEARISIIVLYQPQNDEVASYMNMLCTADAFDALDHSLFAQCSLQKHIVVAEANTTFDQLSDQYYANITDLAQTNREVQLKVGLKFSIKRGVYQVGLKHPGGSQQQISDHFGITVEALKAANPNLKDWPDPLPLLTAIFLPDLSVTSRAGDTLRSIANHYGLTVGSIAGDNRRQAGFFKPGADLIVTAGPTTVKATVPRGVAAVEVERPVPPDRPKDPTAPRYAEAYLNHAFSLLGFRIHKNQFFQSSPYGLPMSPGTTKSEAHQNGKFDRPPILKAGDVWTFRTALPYTAFVDQKIKQKTDKEPSATESPYLGLGNLLQVDFSWNDLYGNRLLTRLDDPQAANSLNQPPVMTEYTDRLLGLSEWPSVTSSWQVTGIPGKATVALLLRFDPGDYDGLWSARIEEGVPNTITAQFTDELDDASANDLGNYTLSDDIMIGSVALQPDGKTVALTVQRLRVDKGKITLQVKGIKTRKGRVFHGSATFDSNGFVSSSLKIQVEANLTTYTLLWYQLTDPLGIDLRVENTLLPGAQTELTDEQRDQLMRQWLLAIYGFLKNRPTNSFAPAPSLTLSFPIVMAQLSGEDIFKLECSFSIGRKRQDLVGNFAYSGELSSSRSPIGPATQPVGASGHKTHSLTAFANSFEQALHNDHIQLGVATGVDRFSYAHGSEATLWAVRLRQTSSSSDGGIHFQINHDSSPLLFSPKPISNELISQSDVAIRPFNSRAGMGKPVSKDFTDVNLDLWCKQLLEAVDHLLTPTYVSAIQLVDEQSGENHSKGLLHAILQQKQRLAYIIQYLMVPVFQDEQGTDMTAIRARFVQSLLKRLSNAYAIQAGIQYSATVGAKVTATPAPQLYGNVAQHPAEAPETDDAEHHEAGGISLTSPKLTLEKSDHTPLAFLMSSPEIIRGQDQEVVQHLELHLSYQGMQIEHQIGRIDGIKGYQASSWLKPISTRSAKLLHSTPLKANVPVPLRAYPSNPQMSSQHGQLADRGFQGQPPINKLLEWDYSVTYGQSFHYPQDELQFEVRANKRTRPGRTAAFALDGADSSGPPDLSLAFNEIAQFISVYPDLQNALADVAQINAATEKDSPLFEQARTTLEVFNELTGNICTKADPSENSINHQMETRAETLSATETYSFTIKESSADLTVDDKPYQGALLVTITGKTPEGFGVPRVQIKDYTTENYSTSSGDYCFYFSKGSGADKKILSASKGQLIQPRTIYLPGLNLLAMQNVSTSVILRRNVELVHGKPTNPDFVYSTGLVKFPNDYFPNFEFSQRINMVEGNGQRMPLKQALASFFANLLEQNGQHELSFGVVVSYTYTINPMGSEIKLPVLMQPVKNFHLQHPKEAPATLLNNWTSAISDWFQANNPSKDNGCFLFDLRIFTNLSPEPKPLIQLQHLYLLVDELEIPT